MMCTSKTVTSRYYWQRNVVIKLIVVKCSLKLMETVKPSDDLVHI